MPLPGGYCTAFCGAGATCPGDGVCVESIKLPEHCAAPCKTDADCRSADHYVCDPTWHACTLPGFLPPQAPACPAAAAPLPRKRFTTIEALSSEKSPGLYQLEPAAALDGSGSLVAAYMTLDVPRLKPDHTPDLGQSNSLAIATVGTTPSPSGDRAFENDRQHEFDAWMAADRQGTVYLAWLGFDGIAPEANMEVGLAQSRDGLTWTAPVAVNDVSTDCPPGAAGCLDKPMIAIGPDPKAPAKDVLYLAYFSDPAGGMKVRRSSDGGKTFGPSVSAGPGAYGDLEVDAAGAVHIVYQETGDAEASRFGDPADGIFYTRSDDGGSTFTSPVQVSAASQPVPFYFVDPHVVSDPARHLLYVVYPAGTNGAWDIELATSKDGGKTFGKPISVNDDSHCATHMNPSAALDPKTGTVHVVWSESRGGGEIAWASCKTGGASCSPNERVSDAPFASFSLARQDTRWQGDYLALVPDLTRRLLHVVYTGTVDDKGVPVSRIFHAVGSMD
jgi:hypothetical protein